MAETVAAEVLIPVVEAETTGVTAGKALTAVVEEAACFALARMLRLSVAGQVAALLLRRLRAVQVAATSCILRRNNNGLSNF